MANFAKFDILKFNEIKRISGTARYKHETLAVKVWDVFKMKLGRKVYLKF